MNLSKIKIYLLNFESLFNFIISQSSKFHIVYYILIILPLAICLRILSPLLLIRLGRLISSRIGHFAANTELYLCEKKSGINIPKQLFFDIFYFAEKPLCNVQLARMWKRNLFISFPWLIGPLESVISLLPGGKVHIIGNNISQDRDVFNLFEKLESNLYFTQKEIERGENNLLLMGIPPSSRVVCLLVRDNEYMRTSFPEVDSNYHSYRNCSIENYVLAVEELVSKGFFVVRMGKHVEKEFPVINPRIVDYAKSSFRSDFMDIYLGFKCEFCISTSSGWDAIPYIFRKPIIYAPIVPLGFMFTFSSKYLAITKYHVDKTTGKVLTINEIFNRGVGFCLKTSEFDSKNVVLIENTPLDIKEIVSEYLENLENEKKISDEDLILQKEFFKVFSNHTLEGNSNVLHGEIKSRFGVNFLKKIKIK
jgi:putative glycosyltransferase (TIGR04372 family)